EGGAGLAGAYDAFALGLGEPVPISAEHGEGMAELYEALAAYVAGDEEEHESDEERDESRPIKVAIVGRPNAGKSTLINRMIGAERLLT
ncbi:50S ribosome-binding GTPase, partial [Escherichia coli]|nr:50S ribosome-binding GTPase [Escherichia coli]